MSYNDSWMPLYIGDYLGDTMELDGAQHGAYLLLLMYYWRNGPLPVADAKLAQIARTELRLWKKTVGPVVRRFFTERDGLLHQKRCDHELARAHENWQRANEQRHNDNQRLRAWRAKDGSHPPTKPNGHGPPEMSVKRVSSAFPNPSQTRCETPPETVAKSVLPSPSTKTFSGEEKEKKSSSLPSNLTVGSRAREETPPADALRTLLDEVGADETPLPHNAMRPLKPVTDSVGSGPVAAQVSRVAKALTTHVPYGVVRGADEQVRQLEAQPAVDTSIYKWQPCDPVRTVEEQLTWLREHAA